MSDAPAGVDVGPEDVRHAAKLARVTLDDEEIERFAEQFREICADFEALEDAPEVDGERELANVLRPDQIEAGLSQAEALRNAPETEDGHFVGPRVS